MLEISLPVFYPFKRVAKTVCAAPKSKSLAKTARKLAKRTMGPLIMR